MSKTTITKFRCDELSCGKEATDSDFPYERGWQYVYNFEAKFPPALLMVEGNAAIKVEAIKIRDKHFCSQKCLIDFLTAQLQKGNNNETTKRQEL